MKPFRCYLIVTICLVIVALVFSTHLLSAQGACSAPLPRPPRQGGGRGMATIFGVQAVISFGNPVLGCSHRSDNYTNEWIMIIGPGNRMPDHPEWIQLGWERSHGHETIHFWYQYRTRPELLQSNATYRLYRPDTVSCFTSTYFQD